MVTLSIEAADGSIKPSGWSTRTEGGGDGRPFSFTPGQGLIAGWTEGVLQMREGERAVLHVPAAKGYGGAAQGQPGGGWCACLLWNAASASCPMFSFGRLFFLSPHAHTARRHPCELQSSL